MPLRGEIVAFLVILANPFSRMRIGPDQEGDKLVERISDPLRTDTFERGRSLDSSAATKDVVESARSAQLQIGACTAALNSSQVGKRQTSGHSRTMNDGKTVVR